MDNTTELLQQMLERFDRLETTVNLLIQQRAIKDFYTTAELAQLVAKAEFTVREWCRLGRIHAQKRACGRGPTQEWTISHEELLRFQNHGLLPAPTTSTRI